MGRVQVVVWDRPCGGLGGGCWRRANCCREHEIDEMFRMRIEKRVGFTLLEDSIEHAPRRTGMLRGVLETLRCHECNRPLAFGWRNVGRIVRGPGLASVS